MELVLLIELAGYWKNLSNFWETADVEKISHLAC